MAAAAIYPMELLPIPWGEAGLPFPGAANRIAMIFRR
jgi:hypothetical protein